MQATIHTHSAPVSFYLSEIWVPVRTEALRRAQDDPCYRRQHRRANRVLQVPRPMWPLHQSTCIPRMLYVAHVWPPRPRAPALLPCPPQAPELRGSQACQAIHRFST